MKYDNHVTLRCSPNLTPLIITVMMNKLLQERIDLDRKKKCSCIDCRLMIPSNNPSFALMFTKLVYQGKCHYSSSQCQEGKFMLTSLLSRVVDDKTLQPQKQDVMKAFYMLPAVSPTEPLRASAYTSIEDSVLRTVAEV